MAGTRKQAAKKTAAKKEPWLWEDSDGRFWIVDGKKKTDAGISKRYANRLLQERLGE